MSPKKLVKPSSFDPENSVSLFDANRENDFGEMYCVAPGILPGEVELYWQEYLDEFRPVVDPTEEGEE
jgi:hypothetical protein